MLKIKKDKNYYVKFSHYLDSNDVIYESVSGKGYFRLRNFYSDLGYQVENINLIDKEDAMHE